MEDTQNVLDAITKQQGQSIDEFEEQVEELKDQLRDLQVCFYTRYVKNQNLIVISWIFILNWMIQLKIFEFSLPFVPYFSMI